MVQESFSLKAESERLLDVAKRAVEIAIEQDESAGSHCAGLRSLSFAVPSRVSIR